jgi:hypothetical protein
MLCCGMLNVQKDSTTSSSWGLNSNAISYRRPPARKGQQAN